MPIPIFTELGPRPDFNDVVNKVNTLVQELQNLMLSLDTLNIVELNAEVIVAGTVTADKMNVNELSAISANLGHITAGLIEAVNIIGSVITGSLIQTKESGNYPRAYMSTDGASFVVETAPGRAVFIHPAGGGVPAVVFQDAGKQTSIDLISGGTIQRINSDATLFGINTPSGTVFINGTDVLASLASLAANKANVFSGLTGFVTVGDGLGGTKQLHFDNGIFKFAT